MINGNNDDKCSFNVHGVRIEYCSKYLYLGAWFTDDGNIRSVLALHDAKNTILVNKFSVFCAANTNMPFKYKKRVFDAAVTSSLVYSVESWFTLNPKCVISKYNQLVRSLLGVRKWTSVNLCLIEAGIPPVQFIISKMTKNFLQKKLLLPDMEEPFHYVYDLCMRHNTRGYRFLRKAREFDDSVNPLEPIKTIIHNQPESSTKYVTYRSVLNPSLSVHKVYSSSEYIPDYIRTSFTRLRLMSHNLKVETGRWSRTPPPLRHCICDRSEVQDEQHVLLQCPLVNDLRGSFHTLNFQSVSELWSNDDDCVNMCTFIHRVLQIFKE